MKEESSRLQAEECQHSGTGFVIDSCVNKKDYPKETLTAKEFCKKHGLDKSLWVTFARRYASFVSVGCGEKAPKEKGVLVVRDEYYYYAYAALSDVFLRR